MRSGDVRDLFDLLPILLAIINYDGSVSWANRAFRDLFPVLQENPSSVEISALLQDTGDKLKEAIRQVIDSGLAGPAIITKVTLHDTADRTLKVDIRSCSGNGRAGQAILTAIDITDQVGLEALKKEAYDQIEKNIEQLAILGDKIRNPVTVISGLCDLLDDRKIAGKIQSQAMEINDTVRMIDQGWIESEKVRSILRKYYNVGVSGTHELVARAIHEEYLAQMKAKGKGHGDSPALRPWDELDWSLKESNLRQADDIWKKLNRIGCGIGIMVDTRSPPFTFSATEVDELAEYEHEQWMQEKIRLGWRDGPVVHAEEKTHDCLVPWQQLPEEQRQKDRNTIRTLPAILARVRLKIVRLEASPDNSGTKMRERG